MKIYLGESSAKNLTKSIDKSAILYKGRNVLLSSDTPPSIELSLGEDRVLFFWGHLYAVHQPDGTTSKLSKDKNSILKKMVTKSNLKELIKKTDIDVVESFTLPEMGGGLTIEEASLAWKDKSIIANIPAFLCYKEEHEIREYMENLLEKVSPRKNFMLELSENFPHPFWKTTLPIIADVMHNQ